MTYDKYKCLNNEWCDKEYVSPSGKHNDFPQCPNCGSPMQYIESFDKNQNGKIINHRIEQSKTNLKSNPKITKIITSESNVPKCPTCGSTKIKPITTIDRMFSVGIFGLASNKINKSYKCTMCKYTW